MSLEGWMLLGAAVTLGTCLGVLGLEWARERALAREAEHSRESPAASYSRWNVDRARNHYGLPCADLRCECSNTPLTAFLPSRHSDRTVLKGDPA